MDILSYSVDGWNVAVPNRAWRVAAHKLCGSAATSCDIARWVFVVMVELAYPSLVVNVVVCKVKKTKCKGVCCCATFLLMCIS